MVDDFFGQRFCADYDWLLLHFLTLLKEKWSRDEHKYCLCTRSSVHLWIHVVHESFWQSPFGLRCLETRNEGVLRMRFKERPQAVERDPDAGFITNKQLYPFLPRSGQESKGPLLEVETETETFVARLVCLGCGRGVEFSNGHNPQHKDIVRFRMV